MSRLCFVAFFLAMVLPISTEASWTPKLVSNIYSPLPNHRIVPDGSGGVLVVWLSEPNGDPTPEYDIRVQRIDSEGTVLWGDGKHLTVDVVASEPLGVTSDGFGGVLLTWIDGRDALYDLYAARVTVSGALPWGPSGAAVAIGTAAQEDPCIAPDGLGGAIIAWADGRSPSQVTFWDIYAQRVRASDGAIVWTGFPDGVKITDAVKEQRIPVIVSDAANGAIVAWRDGRTGLNSEFQDIYAQRVNANGVPQWDTNGKPICTVFERDDNPRIVSDGAGGAVIAWEHLGNNFDVYAQRVKLDGSIAVGWPNNGLLVCGAIGGQTQITLVEDGTNGAIIAWLDARATHPDIYARRISGDGTPQWSVDGNVVCDANPSDQKAPDMVADGAGGAMIVWADTRSLGSVYGQRVKSQGQAHWADDGVALQDTIWHTVSYPNIAFTGGGTAIVAYRLWNPQNPSLYNLYVARIDGTTTSVGDAPTPFGLSIQRNYPNPFSQGTELEIELASSAAVSIAVYDVTGRHVRTERVKWLPQGLHRIQFDARDDAGEPLASGIYFYSVTANGTTVSRKITIVR